MHHDIDNQTIRAGLRRGCVYAALLAAAFGASAAQAQSAAGSAAPLASEISHSTQAWLDLQGSNRAATPHPQPMIGAAASLAYQRYLESFKSKIPVFYGSSSGSGGGGPDYLLTPSSSQ
ncbi:DUF3613 domain-containing protein [Burkholderia alba]|uniref:DUF3613 domain-containing protein n=1 Tax=Burkholderia alba TaxID=2683677 RepID=UPI002B05FF54|nr:DUF3613 domain-containing protein [Burkholderia alba]